MFWTNWNEQKPSIMRSTLAGKNMRIIISSDILTPNGLTLDHKAEKLYFSDGSLGKIERCDYDGSSRYVSSKPRMLTVNVLNCGLTFFQLFFLKTPILSSLFIIIKQVRTLILDFPCLEKSYKLNGVMQETRNDSLVWFYPKSLWVKKMFNYRTSEQQDACSGTEHRIYLPFYPQRKQLLCSLPFNFNPHWARTIWPLVQRIVSEIPLNVLSDISSLRLQMASSITRVISC